MEEIKKETVPKKQSRLSKFLDRYNDGPRAMRKSNFICVFCFTIIPIIHFFVFYVYGNYYSFFLAFTKIVDGKYVGSLDNFKSVFQMLASADSSLMIAIRNTAILFVKHILQLCFNFVIAYAFAKGLKGAKFYRIMIFLPSIISALALSTIVKNFLADDGALTGLWKQLFGKPFPALFFDEKTAYPTLLGYSVWAGFYLDLLLFEGAIRRIPQDALDAGQLDGVTKAQELFKIIIPMMWDTISVILILCVCSLFTISLPILLFTDGAYNTQTLQFWFYQQVQYNGNINQSAAVGLVITAINLPIVFGFRALMNKLGDSIEY